jgi:hypothetical protein
MSDDWWMEIPLDENFFKWRYTKWKLRKGRKGSPRRMLTPKGKLIITRKQRRKIKRNMEWALGEHAKPYRDFINECPPPSFDATIRMLRAAEELQIGPFNSEEEEIRLAERDRRTLALAYMRGWRATAFPKRRRGRPRKKTKAR